MRRHRRARSIAAAALAGALALALAAPVRAADASGRWEGVVDVPGAPMRIVIDLERDAAGWAGSVTLPGRGVKGAPLAALAVADDGVRFGLGAALRFAPAPLPQLALQWRGAALAGSYTHAGLQAPVVLVRSGAAQVDRAPRPTPLPAALAGTWRGRYELAGTPRDVTLTLARGADGLGRGELQIVGRRSVTLPIDLVLARPAYVTLHASAAELRIEGRWRAGEGEGKGEGEGEIDGLFVQGPFEAPLKLRRQGGGGS